MFNNELFLLCIMLRLSAAISAVVPAFPFQGCPPHAGSLNLERRLPVASLSCPSNPSHIVRCNHDLSCCQRLSDPLS
jgi:hypothetical protein